jgi:hypothetical protein
MHVIDSAAPMCTYLAAENKKYQLLWRALFAPNRDIATHPYTSTGQVLSRGHPIVPGVPPSCVSQPFSIATTLILMINVPTLNLSMQNAIDSSYYSRRVSLSEPLCLSA